MKWIPGHPGVPSTREIDKAWARYQTLKNEAEAARRAFKILVETQLHAFDSSRDLGGVVAFLPGPKPFFSAVRTCDWGECDEIAVDSRWSHDLKRYLAVCATHREGS